MAMTLTNLTFAVGIKCGVCRQEKQTIFAVTEKGRYDMARCEDCIHNKVCLHKANIQTDTYAYMGVSYDTEKCEHYKPTADVVPKSEVARLQEDVDRLQEINNRQVENIKLAKQEVAREIFEEIEERIATHAFTSKSEDYSDGAFDTIAWVDSKLDELKKKYQEGEPNG
jgi:hypothetical protein